MVLHEVPSGMGPPEQAYKKFRVIRGPHPLILFITLLKRNSKSPGLAYHLDVRIQFMNLLKRDLISLEISYHLDVGLRGES